MALDPAGWSRFSHDPLTPSALRASDADRSIACDLLGQAYAEGLIDAEEHSERTERATSLRTVSEIAPLLEDIMPAPGTAPSTGASLERLRATSDIPLTPEAIDETARADVRARLMHGVLWTFGLPVGICLAVWTLTSLSAGHAIFFWPLFVMIGTGTGVLGLFSQRRNLIASRRRTLTRRAREALGDADPGRGLGPIEDESALSHEERRAIRRRRHHGHHGNC